MIPRHNAVLNRRRAGIVGEDAATVGGIISRERAALNGRRAGRTVVSRVEPSAADTGDVTRDGAILNRERAVFEREDATAVTGEISRQGAALNRHRTIVK